MQTIDGLQYDMPGKDFRAWLEARATWHEGRSEFYASEASKAKKLAEEARKIRVQEEEPGFGDDSGGGLESLDLGSPRAQRAYGAASAVRYQPDQDIGTKYQTLLNQAKQHRATADSFRFRAKYTVETAVYRLDENDLRTIEVGTCY